MTTEPTPPEPHETSNAPEPLPPLDASALDGPPAAATGESSEPAAERPKAYRAPAKDPLAQIADAIREITPVLDAADMEPDPTRTDWTRSRGQIDAAHSLYKGEILAAIDDALRSLPTGNELRVKVAANVAWIGAELAALLWASKRTDDAQRLLLQVVKIAPTTAPDGANVKAELEGALADTASWVELTRARYLQRSRQWEEGDRILRAVRGRATHAAVKAAIDKQLGGARPLTGGPPPLFRINGCGASIYGERDRRPDGSYVTTYCVALLFIPVWPISAYRVVDHGNGSYGFMAKEPLSAFARGYRWVLAGVVGLWMASAAFTSWLSDPHRLANNAFADTRAEVASMDTAGALAAWERLATEHGYSLTGEARDVTGTELVRLTLDQVEAPMTAARAAEVESAIARYRALPELAHGRAQAELLTERVLAWQSDVGSASHEDTLASMRILDALETASTRASSPELAEVEELLASQGLGSAVGGRPAASPEIAARRAGLHRVMGEQVASEWPLEAIEHWTAAGDPASIERAGTTLAELSSSRSLLLEIERPVSSYLALTTSGQEPRDSIALALDAARAMRADEGRRLALESGDERALRAVLVSYPGDQETIAALATAKRQAGDVAGAHALLDPLGPPGRLAGPAQLARANLLADEGQLADAAALLGHHVNARLPAWENAQRAYRSAFDARTAGLEAQLRSPYPPRELERRLTGVTSDEEGRGIVQAWFLEQLTADAHLTELRAALEAHSNVVPSILALAMLELRLGNDTTGEVRDGHFREAERLFLAVREEAEGLPSFHLGLGQVHHRLGRPAEGDAEIAQVIATGDPALELEAAHTYRELGINSRASELATSIYDRGVQPTAGNAALLMSLLATTLEDEELWLGRADQSAPFVQVNLLQARARRLARDGDLRQAERLFGQVADRHLALSAGGGARDTASLNNAAIATQQRYECSGNPAHLSRAVDLMEQALRGAPESGLTASNVADMHAYAGRIAVLDGFVHTRDLHLDGRSSEDLLAWLLAGTQRDAVIAAMREQTSLRRAVEVSHQAEALSPQRTDAYELELTIHEALGDGAAIHTLRERVSRVPNLETSVAQASAERWQGGELDQTMLTSLESAITTRRARLEALRGGHAPTFAAAAVMLAGSLTERGHVRREVADLAEAVSLLREAEAAAPGLGTRTLLAHTRVAQGLLELASTSPPAQSIVEAGWRSAPAGVLCARLNADAAARGPAAASATLRDAATLLHGAPDLGVQSLALAALVGDDELAAATRTEASTERARDAFAIRVALAPWAPYAELAALLD